MKKCPYCGAEYPDDATVCAIDQTPFEQPHFENLATTLEGASGHPDHKATDLTFPDYQWTARGAWKCVGMILVFQFVTGLVYSAIDWHFYGFYRWREYNGFGRCSMMVVYFAIGLMTAAYFARTETLTSFWKGFGLDRQPSEYVYFGLALALIVSLVGHFAIMYGWNFGWEKGISNNSFSEFKQATGNDKYMFLVSPLLLSPLCEEAINRGFLYKAFRGSYSIKVSMLLLTAWTAYTHWGYYRHSYLTALDLSVLTIVQCYLREKSDSLWDSILCHFAYNASIPFVENVFQ